MPITDGGNAFAYARSDTDTSFPGMSLRDYFAAAAINGMLSALNPAATVSFKSLAMQAYAIADAMLEQRQ